MRIAERRSGGARDRQRYGAQFIRVCILASHEYRTRRAPGNAMLGKNRARLENMSRYSPTSISNSYPPPPIAQGGGPPRREVPRRRLITAATGVSVDEGHLDEIRGVCSAGLRGSGVTLEYRAVFPHCRRLYRRHALKESNALMPGWWPCLALVTALRERAAARQASAHHYPAS
jgi:hypothetical protein